MNDYQCSWHIDSICTLQGVSYWSVPFELTLADRNMEVKFCLKVVLESWDWIFLGMTTSFQKSNDDWPQQPPTEKLPKFNIIFHDSTPKSFFSKHKNTAEFKYLDDSEVLSSDFPGLKTSAASMTSVTSTASMTSMASMTSTASFHQKIYWSWLLDHSWYQNDQYLFLFVEWIIKNSIFQ